MPRPRFSLRTLLFSVLALGAATTLWQNFAPWRFTREFTGMQALDGTFVLSPDGRWLASHYFRTELDQNDEVLHRQIFLWNVNTGASHSILDAKSPNLRELKSTCKYSFSPDSKYFLLGESSDEKANFQLVQLETMKQAKLLGEEYGYDSYSFSQDGRFVGILWRTLELQLIELSTRKTITRISNVLNFAFSSVDDRLAILKFNDSNITLLDAATGKEFRQITAPDSARPRRVLHFGKQLIVQTSTPIPNSSVQARDALLAFNSVYEPRYLPNGIVSISPRGDRAISDDEKSRSVLDLESGATLFSFTGGIYSAPEFTWAGSDGAFVGALDGSIFLPSNGKPLYTLHNVYGIHLSPDNSRMLGIKISSPHSDGPLQLLETKTGNVLQSFPKMTLYKNEPGSPFTPDNQHFIALNEKAIPQLFTRHRPEQWWGLAYLPEFWLTLLLAPTALLSLWRDRRST